MHRPGQIVKPYALNLFYTVNYGNYFKIVVFALHYIFALFV